MQNHYIYIFQNKLNNKIYVGQSVDPIRRKSQHKYNCFVKNENNRFYNSLRKHGWSNFKFEIIEEHDLNSIDEGEQFWIQYFRSWDPNFGYNIDLGGNFSGKITSDETKKKQSVSATGRICSEETKLKHKINRLGKKHSEESKNKIATANTGISFSSERCSAISAAAKGEGNSGAKLKETEVIEIIRLAELEIPDRDLAAKFNVSRHTIRQIRYGVAWKHLPRN